MFRGGGGGVTSRGRCWGVTLMLNNMLEDNLTLLCCVQAEKMTSSWYLPGTLCLVLLTCPLTFALLGSAPPSAARSVKAASVQTAAESFPVKSGGCSVPAATRVPLGASVVGGTTCFCLVVCPHFIGTVEQMVTLPNYGAPYSGRAPGGIDFPLVLVVNQ